MAADGTPGPKGNPQFLGTGAPATAADLNTISMWAANNIDRRVANVAARDALPNKYVGMVVQTADTETLWVCTNAGGSGTWITAVGVKRTTGSSGSVTTTLTSIMSLSLEAGTWEIDGQGYIEKSTTGAQTFTAQLWNATAAAEIDVAKIGAAGDAFWPLRVKDVVTLGATSTIQFRVATSATNGTQLFSNGKLFAKRAALI